MIRTFTRREFLSVSSAAAATILLGGCGSVDETANWTKEEALDFTIKHPDGWKMQVDDGNNSVIWGSDDGIIMAVGKTTFSSSLDSDLVAQTIYSGAASSSNTTVGELEETDNKNGLKVYQCTRQDKTGSGIWASVFEDHSYYCVYTTTFNGKDEAAVTKVLNTLAVKDSDDKELLVFEK